MVINEIMNDEYFYVNDVQAKTIAEHLDYRGDIKELDITAIRSYYNCFDNKDDAVELYKTTANAVLLDNNVVYVGSTEDICYCICGC